MVKHAKCAHMAAVLLKHSVKGKRYIVTTQGPCVGCEKLGEIKGAYTLLYHVSDVNTLISVACHESI